MDSDSKKIRAFIKKNQIHQRKKRTGKTFSKESRIFIEKMFFYMKQGSLNYSDKTTYVSLEELPTGNYFHLLDEEIKNNIENQIKKYTKTTFQIDTRTFHIYMCFPKIRFATAKKQIDTWIHYIYVWLFVASHFSVASCSKKLSIYLYYTDLKKILPEINGDVIKKEHSNTAFTFACTLPENSRENEIYIYREEEWFKVFLHETFHSLGLDFAAMENTTAQNYICSEGDIYSVPCTDLRFYESYTETWAEIIQCMFAVVFNDNQTNDSVGKLEEFVYGYEAYFSAFQATKVLDHFGLVYEDLFHKGAASNYKEKTPIFSYYIIKSVFMNHADEFIRWNMENNRGSLQFKKTQNNVHHFVELLKSLCKKEEYIETMHEMDIILEKNTHIMLATTMRMSCVSII